MENPFFNSPESKMHAPTVSLKPKPGAHKHKGVSLHVPERFAWGKSKTYPGQALFGIASPAPFHIKSFTAIPLGVIPDNTPAAAATATATATA